jgi:hypothetical protein
VEDPKVLAVEEREAEAVTEAAALEPTTAEIRRKLQDG